MFAPIPEIEAALVKVARMMEVDTGVLPIFESLERDLEAAKRIETTHQRARILIESRPDPD